MKSLLMTAIVALSSSAFAGGVIPLSPGASLPISSALDGFTVTCSGGAQVSILNCFCEEKQNNMFTLHVTYSNGAEKLMTPVQFRISCDREKEEMGCPAN
jgi:hypothetical protein